MGCCCSVNGKGVFEDPFLRDINKAAEKMKKKYPKAFLKHCEWYAKDPCTWNFIFEQQDHTPEGLKVYNPTMKSKFGFLGKVPPLGDEQPPKFGFYGEMHADTVTKGPRQAKREARKTLEGTGWEETKVDCFQELAPGVKGPSYEITFVRKRDKQTVTRYVDAFESMTLAPTTAREGGAEPVAFAVSEAPTTALAVSEAPKTAFAVSEAPRTALAVSEAPKTAFAVSEAPKTALAVSEARKPVAFAVSEAPKTAFAVSEAFAVGEGTEAPEMAFAATPLADKGENVSGFPDITLMPEQGDKLKSEENVSRFPHFTRMPLQDDKLKSEEANLGGSVSEAPKVAENAKVGGVSFMKRDDKAEKRAAEGAAFVKLDEVDGPPGQASEGITATEEISSEGTPQEIYLGTGAPPLVAAKRKRIPLRK